MIVNLSLFFLGIGILFVSGDVLIRASIDLSEKMAVSPAIIGLTIVAFGTSIPELLVAVQATLDGFEDLALGNIVGSNIANILLILGVPSLIVKIRNSETGLIKNYYFMLAVTLGFVYFLSAGQISFGHGLFLIGLLLVFVISTIFYKSSFNPGSNQIKFVKDQGGLGLSKIVIFIFVGFCGLPLGSKILINGATRFAEIVGISEAIIGLTLVAVGTSLPELTTSVVAAYRKETGLLLGNVIGSNMFNILGIAGVAALISPLTAGNGLDNKAMFFLIISSLAIMPFILWQHAISRLIGTSFIFLYICYIMTLTQRLVQL